jgi:hypothetical protein
MQSRSTCKTLFLFLNVTLLRGRRRKHLFEDVKEKRRYWNLKEAALDITPAEKGYRPIAREIKC